MSQVGDSHQISHPANTDKSLAVDIIGLAQDMQSTMPSAGQCPCPDSAGEGRRRESALRRLCTGPVLSRYGLVGLFPCPIIGSASRAWGGGGNRPSSVPPHLAAALGTRDTSQNVARQILTDSVAENPIDLPTQAPVPPAPCRTSPLPLRSFTLWGVGQCGGLDWPR